MQAPAVVLWAAAWLGAASLGGWQPSARAAPALSTEQPPSAADRDTARRLMETGADRWEAADYAGALEAFGAADQIMKVPTTGLWVGRARAKVGLLVEARDTLLRVVNHPARPDEPPPYAGARDKARELQQKLAVRIPSLQVEVLGPKQGAALEVSVDDHPLRGAAARAPRSVNPGQHVVSATAPGFSGASQEVSLAEGQTKILRITLRPGGKQQGGQDLPPPPPESSNAVSPLVWAGFGVGAAGVVVGTITGALTLSMSADLEQQCQDKACDPSLQSDIDTANGLAHTATVSFVVGGVGAAVGVIGLLLSGDEEQAATPPPGRAARRELVPTLWPVGLRGRF